MTNLTHVVRIVSGSLADIHPNERVDVHLVSGTRIIDRLQIDGSRWYTTSSKHLDGGYTDIAARLVTHVKPSPRPGAKQTTSSTQNLVSGHVVTVGPHSLTLSGLNGKQSTYSLSSSLAVTKIMNGGLGDLSFGEIVQVMRDRNGNASCVAILSA